jgi:tRNA G18 (ribose-2'-O)-methylase SpoU
MSVQRLTGPDDPQVADYRDIAEADLMRSRGLFVAEGRLVVRRLIEDRRHTLRSVLVNEAAYHALETTLAAAQVPTYVCETRDFLGITGHDIHRGCLALVERPRALSVTELLAAVRPPLTTVAPPSTTVTPPCATLIVLEGVTDPDNVGGVFRNAAAFGAIGVLLDPACCDPLYRKSIRTSMAAVLRVPFARVDAWPHGLGALRELGFTIAALTPRAPAVTIDRFAASRPPRVALLVGTEGAGLSGLAESAADTRVRIPIADDIDSLNLAVAVGIALHRLSTM